MSKVKLVNGKLPKGRKCLIRLSDLGSSNSNISNRWLLEMDVLNSSLWFCCYNNKAWYELRGKDINKNISLNENFRNWRNPTKNEVDYFKMITGLPYLTDYLKIEPLDD